MNSNSERAKEVERETDAKWEQEYDAHVARAAEANACPAGKILAAAGYKVQNNGGNILVWCKPSADKKAEVYISIPEGLDDEFGDLVGVSELGEGPLDLACDCWLVGIYNSDDLSLFSADVPLTRLANAIKIGEEILAAPDDYLPGPKRVAKEFIEILRAMLSKGEWKEMVKRNTEDTDPLVCHSHDFCDANMAMEPAFHDVMGFQLDADREDHCAIWNKAWEIAREMALGMPKVAP